MGAGPRGGLALITAAKVRAALFGRPEVDIEDVRSIAAPVLRHRIILNYSAEAEGESPDTLIQRLIAEVPVKPSQGGLDERVQSLLKS